jgi:hypothetical protein
MLPPQNLKLDGRIFSRAAYPMNGPNFGLSLWAHKRLMHVNVPLSTPFGTTPTDSGLSETMKTTKTIIAMLHNTNNKPLTCKSPNNTTPFNTTTYHLMFPTEPISTFRKRNFFFSLTTFSARGFYPQTFTLAAQQPTMTSPTVHMHNTSFTTPPDAPQTHKSGSNFCHTTSLPQIYNNNNPG